MKSKIHIIIGMLLLVCFSAHHVKAQQTSPVGVSLIVVNFDQAPDPDLVSVTKAPLKYNKKFALTMQIDDGDLSIFEQGYPVFEGGMVSGTTFPGMTYSDGCGNNHQFKMSSVLYSFNGDGENGPDTHQDNAYGMVSWEQLNTMSQNNWGIINHGVNSNASTGEAFMDYSILRNQSYIRRQLYETIPGGVVTNLHVNPNGSIPWTAAASDVGYLSTFNQNEPSPLSIVGGDVNSSLVDWTLFQNIYRVDAGPTNIQNFVVGLADSSQNGANYWGVMFTHSLINQYTFDTFVSDFNFIHTAYGTPGLDNILMTSDAELREYLLVRDVVEVNYAVVGSSLFITFNGEVPDNLRYYAMSLNISSNSNITGYTLNGTDDYSYNGVGTQESLLNFSWEGLVVPLPEQQADDYTTMAVATGTQYDAYIAMDYVTTLEPGQHKDSLRHVLCDLGLDYDAGFCNFLSVDLGSDTTICQGNCVPLAGPDNMSLYEWIVADTLYASSQSIIACPVDTTQYKLVVEDEFGNTASDSITINVIPSVVFDLGNDTTLCKGDSLLLEGPMSPEGEEYVYLWSTGAITPNITVYATVDSLYYLDVTNVLECTSSDSISLFVFDLPIIDSIVGDTSLCPGDSTLLEVWGSDIESYLWNTGDTTQVIKFLPEVYDTTYVLSVVVTNGSGCQTTDSALVVVNKEVWVDFESDTLAVCQGEDAYITVSSSSNISNYSWVYGSLDSTTIFGNILFQSPEISSYVYVRGDSYAGCYALDSMYLSIQAYPEIVISNDTSICSGQSVTLSIQGGSLFYWAVDGDTLSNDSILEVTPMDTTVYTVGTAFADSLCFRDTTITVNVMAMPTTTILYDTNLVCEHSMVTLLAEGADSYEWRPSGEVGDVYEFVIQDTTEIGLIGTSVHGCVLNDTLVINTLPAPLVAMSGLYPAYCESDPISVLMGLPKGGTFSGEGVVDSLFDPKLAGSGSHAIVYAFSNEEGCYGYDTLFTTVYGGGEPIDLGRDTMLMPNDQLVLDAGIGFDSYFWSTGSHLPTITVYGVDNPPGTYEYKVIGLISGCTSTGSINITFYNPDFIDATKAGVINLYPNPNKGVFSIVLPYSKELQTVRVFSLQGNLVFESADLRCAGEACVLEVELPNLNNGLYTIQLISGELVFINKMMIRK